MQNVGIKFWTKPDVQIKRGAKAAVNIWSHQKLKMQCSLHIVQHTV